jgi:hypothetical protein
MAQPPGRWQHRRDCRSGASDPADWGFALWRRPENRRGVHGPGRRVHALRPLLRIFIAKPPALNRSVCSAGAHGGVVAPMERSVSRCWALEGGGQALTHHLEGFDLCPNRRDRRCCDDIASRAARRRAELGLPLLLAKGRHSDAPGFHATRNYDEARAWRDWLIRTVAGSPRQVQIMYVVGGERWLPELSMPWWPIGNWYDNNAD